MIFKKFLFLTILATTMLSLSACKDEESTVVTPDDPKSKILVVHASPNAPKVDILIDNSFVDTLSYTRNTAYLEVNSGTRNVKIRVTGTSSVLIDANASFDPDKSYSIFAIDSLIKISALQTLDDLTTPAAGKAHIRFIHLSPDAPAVNVIANGSTTLFANRSFNKIITASEQAFIQVNADTYNLEVRKASDNVLALSLPNVTLTSGKIYTIFAKGFLDGTAAQALGAQIIANN